MSAEEFRVEGRAAYGVVKEVISLPVPYPVNIYIGVVDGFQM